MQLIPQVKGALRPDGINEAIIVGFSVSANGNCCVAHHVRGAALSKQQKSPGQREKKN